MPYVPRTLSPCHLVTLSPSHPVTLSPCHLVTLSPCRPVTLSSPPPLSRLQEIHARAKRIKLRSSGRGANPELALALRLEGQVRLALCVAYGALKRTESRGCHSREDFPARNDRDWLNRTLATWAEGADLPTLAYEPASPAMELPPGDRGYGTAGKVISAEEDVGERRDG